MHANQNVRYEKQDVRPKPLLAASIGLVALLVAVGTLVAGLFAMFAADTNRTPPPAAVVDQSAAARELQQLRRHETEQLTNYGWVSREKSIVRIPIERAMQLTAERAKEKHDSP